MKLDEDPVIRLKVIAAQWNGPAAFRPEKRANVCIGLCSDSVSAVRNGWVQTYGRFIAAERRKDVRSKRALSCCVRTPDDRAEPGREDYDVGRSVDFEVQLECSRVGVDRSASYVNALFGVLRLEQVLQVQVSDLNVTYATHMPVWQIGDDGHVVHV